MYTGDKKRVWAHELCVEKNSCASIRVFTRETRVRNAALVVDFVIVYVFACVSDEAPYCAATYKRVRELTNIAFVRDSDPVACTYYNAKEVYFEFY